MCELWRQIAIAIQKLAGPITRVFNNHRDQWNTVVMALAGQRGITLRYLPFYSLPR